MMKETSPIKALGPVTHYLLAILVGVIAGLGAVVFRGLIAYFHNLLFLGKISFIYDANIHTPANPWGPLVILVPILGALGVAFLVKNFAPEAKGAGVPETMDAIYYNRGVIRPIVAVIKSLASALSIGSGGSLGREGPIIQIGSAFGSGVGQLIRMPVWQRISLIAGGAGGGIAATFNTPIGGVLFAVEIMLREVSFRTLVPVTISTATATYIGRIFFGLHPSFVVPSFETPYFHLTNPLVLLSYVGLGVVMGAVSAIFIKSIYGFEDFFEKRVRGSYYKQHLIGMLLVGIIMYLLMSAQGHYYIEGVGYSAIQDILSGTLSQFGLLLVLFALKLIATSLTLGSGASGGIFSPALFLGASMGGAYGIILTQFLPGLSISPPAFAVAGMAGVVGGSTGAAMAAIVMIFEMTLDYSVIIPMTITVALSYGLRRLLSRDSIYTHKLARRGHCIPEARHMNFHQLSKAGEVMDTGFVVVPALTRLDKFMAIVAERSAASCFLANDVNKIVGVITRDSIPEILGQVGKPITAGDIANKNFITVADSMMLTEVIAAMQATRVSVALVTEGSMSASPENVKGVITRQQIADAVVQTMELFSDCQG